MDARQEHSGMTNILQFTSIFYIAVIIPPDAAAGPDRLCVLNDTVGRASVSFCHAGKKDIFRPIPLKFFV